MTSEESYVDIAEQIHGLWVLDHMVTVFADGRQEENPDAQGKLMYHSDLRTVFAEISRPDSQEAAGKLEFQYTGHFQIQDENHIRHDVEWSTNPKFVKSLQREFQLSADKLYIVGPSAKYDDANVVITWRRAGPDY